RTVGSGSDLALGAGRQLGRAVATQLGCSPTEAAVIATAISELARNIVLYAKEGEIGLMVANGEGKQGIMVVARDQGPGIADVSRAVTEGYSTSGGLGIGLSGVRRLVDEFEVSSELGRGPTVTIKRVKR